MFEPIGHNELKLYGRIGLFDSGLGGLSVLRRLGASPGHNSFVYVADTARCPYGNRTGEEVALFVEQIVAFLEQKKVDAIVMACNTSAALAKAAAERVASVPVFDLIVPTAMHVATLPEKVGVMATVATARSHAFANAIQQINPKSEVVEYGCPELVPFVESGTVDSDDCRNILSQYVGRLRADAVKNVILGCTHFPFLLSVLEELANGELKFLDPAQILSGTATHERVQSYACELYSTGDPNDFARGAKVCLGDMPFAVQQIDITDLTVCRLDELYAISQESLASSTTLPVVH
jgi:glutamate racemase